VTAQMIRLHAHVQRNVQRDVARWHDAQFMAEAAERLVEGRGWLPSVLRTQAGVPAEAQEAGEGADDETRTAPNDDAYAFAAE
jgi:hypothetical protein